MLQREMAELVAQLAVHFGWPRVAPEGFAAVGIMDRGRRADQIGVRTFAVEREPDGGFEVLIVLTEDVPDLRRGNAIVPSGPHFDLLFVAPEESVGDDAVLIGKLAGGHVGLHGAGDAGKTWGQGGLLAVARELA